MLRLIWGGFIWLRSVIRSRHDLGLKSALDVTDAADFELPVCLRYILLFMFPGRTMILLAVAVGTIITDRPPHRSVRALLRIRLPPWMTGVKTLHGIRM